MKPLQTSSNLFKPLQTSSNLFKPYLKVYRSPYLGNLKTRQLTAQQRVKNMAEGVGFEPTERKAGFEEV